ncbi:MAG: hypothetical protein WCK91_03350 [bacterium]
MQAYIKNLQSKPEHVRKQILVVSLALSMIVVGFIWFYGLTDRFVLSAEKSSIAAADGVKEESPFKLFSNSISNAYENITASVGNITLPNSNPKTETDAKGKQIDLIVVDPKTQN